MSNVSFLTKKISKRVNTCERRVGRRLRLFFTKYFTTVEIEIRDKSRIWEPLRWEMGYVRLEWCLMNNEQDLSWERVDTWQDLGRGSNKFIATKFDYFSQNILRLNKNLGASVLTKYFLPFALISYTAQVRFFTQISITHLAVSFNWITDVCNHFVSI